MVVVGGVVVEECVAINIVSDPHSSTPPFLASAPILVERSVAGPLSLRGGASYGQSESGG